MRARTMAPAVALPAAMAMLVALAAAPSGQAADHLDFTNGTESEVYDQQSDINDLYAFEGADADATVLAMTVHPLATAESTFGSDVLYQFNVDTDAAAEAPAYESDGEANVTYDVEFSDATDNGSQSLYVMRTDVDADTSELVAFGRVGETLQVKGGGTVWTGLRNDPFFFDLAGFQGTVTGMDNGRGLNDGDEEDFFASLDTLAIVLEVPDTALDGDNPIALWATTSMDGTQTDRMGRPGINTAITDTGPLINADEFAVGGVGPFPNIKDVYNSLPTNPDDRDAAVNDFELGLVANSVSIYSSLDAEDSYSNAQLGALGDVFLPDVLPFDKSSGLPGLVEGRALEDDVIDVALRVLTGGDPLGLFDDRDADGAINTDGIDAPTGEYLDVFPYLGEPNGADKVEAANVDDFHAPLSGDAEVPSVATDGGGAAALTLSDDGATLEHLEIVYGVDDVVAAHIHVGGPDENGPVVAFLFGPDAGTTPDGLLADGEVVAGDLTAGDMENLADVLNDGFAYVNVHTAANPGGEVRGQVNALEDMDQFSDDDGGIHETNIGILADAGVIAGCNAGGTLYCPTDNTTRAQMAALFARALNLPASDVDAFDDDNGSPFEDDINALAAVGITQGTASGDYAGTQQVTRGEMAAFVRRAWDLPASDTDAFSDDDGNIFEEDINAIAAAGVTVGASDGMFDPQGDITRGQMASFLAGAFGWRD